MKTLTFNEDHYQCSNEPEKLKKLISELKIEYELDRWDYHFERDKEKRHILKVRITKDQNKYEYKFGASIHDTNRWNSHLKEIEQNLAYDILCDVGSDLYVSRYTFEEFCEELYFTCDPYEDQKFLRKQYNKLKTHTQKLEKVFNLEDIDCLPF